MKNFEEIFNELQSNNNTEFDRLFKELQAKKQKSKKITITICLIIDIFLLLFLIITVNVSKFYIVLIMPTLVPVIILNLLVFLIVNVCVGTNKVQSEFNNKFKDIVIKKLITNFYDSA